MLKAPEQMTPATFRDARLRLGLSQGDMAQLLGCRRETVNSWEVGRVNLPRSMVFTLLGVFETVKAAERERPS